ncbi:hypothetical protein [endosymbiont GvMRE of Glomus versiforme]|uniref:hypothetical protein n=1 Tax=endosymbiont GvMRE of Glomus versiforme TaxID=2039283 RepID=UPI000EEFAFD1|nr:hypothetical protein [endosymbiont GvMRE of Glomus versiforme]RHZ35777.1 hypothetical protein GvMRE_Ic5g55 [endosymbiont GvMRE of Glomus versiforme]
MNDILLKNATDKEMLEEVMKRKGIKFEPNENSAKYPYKLMLVDKETINALKKEGQLKVKYDEKN